MKKTLITLGVVAALSGVGMAANAESSMAATSGAYITAGMGYMSHSVSDKQASEFLANDTQATAHSSGLYSKLGLGYDFNSMFGIEADWYHMPTISASFAHGSYPIVHAMMFDSANKLALLGKVMYPINDSFKFIGAAGVGYAMYHTNSVLPVRINASSKAAKKDSTYSRIVPMVQAGVEYSASKHVGLDLNVNYSFKNGQIPSAIGADFGVSYHF